MKRLISFALFLVMLFVFPSNTVLVNAQDADQVFCNGTDHFVASDGAEFFINSDDEDKLYKASTDGDVCLALDEHIILLVNNCDTAYLVVYRNDECKLMRFDASGENYSDIYSFPDIVSNIAMRNDELLYTLDGAAYSLDLCSLSVSTIKEVGADTLYFDENNSLKFISETDHESQPEKSLKKASNNRNVKSNASGYTPRLTAPATDNPYYTTLNVFHNSGYGMAPNVGNCTCYAFGRSYENLGTEPKLCHNNAGDWYSYNKNNGFYSYGSTPVLGAVSVWKSGGAGHVAVVEVINGDSVTTSESGWQSFYFKTVTRSASNSNFSASSYYSFQGFIYVLGTSVDPTISVPEGVYTFHNVRAIDNGADRVIDVDINSIGSQYASLRIADANLTQAQKFRVIKDGDGYYIKSVYTDKYLDISTPVVGENNHNVQLYYANTLPEEKWVFLDAGNGNVYIHNTTFEVNVDTGGNYDNNTGLVTYVPDGTTSQQWKMVRVSPHSSISIEEGVYEIHNVRNPARVMDIQNDSTEDFAIVQLYDDINSQVEKWRIVKLGAYYGIQSVYSGKWLDVHAPIIGEQEQTIQLYSVNTNPEEKWVFEDAGGGKVLIRSLNDIYLDTGAGGPTDNRTPLKSWNYDASTSQQWTLVRTTEQPTAVLSIDKTAYTTQSEVTFTFGGSNSGTNFTLGLYKDGIRIEGLQVEGNTYKRVFSEPGEYSAYMTAYSYPAYADSNWVYWTVGENYSVKFNSNGATSGSMSNQSFTYDVAQNLTANTFRREHTVTYEYNGATGGNSVMTDTAEAVFNGWATSADGAKVYDDRQSVNNLTTNGTVDLYANWTLGVVTLPTPTKHGYTFGGWNTEADGTGASYAAGASYTIDANVTLYAKWTALPEEDAPYWGDLNGDHRVDDEDYSLVLRSLKGMVELTPEQLCFADVNIDGSVNITDYTILLIYTSGNGSIPAKGDSSFILNNSKSTYFIGDSFDNNALFVNVLSKDDNEIKYRLTGCFEIVGFDSSTSGEKVIAVKYRDMIFYTTVTVVENEPTSDTYIVIFNGNGATSGSMSNQSFIYDVAQNLTANAFRREHTVTYEYNGATGGNSVMNDTAEAVFNGWATSADGAKVYDDRQSVNNLTTNGTVDLFANWTLSFVTLPTPTKTGYTFGGWNTEADGTGTSYAAGASYAVNESVTLYAQWEPVAVPAQSSVLSAAPASTEPYYVQGSRDYLITVSGHPDKLQFVFFSGTTKTFSKTQAVVIDNGDGTESWKITASLKADDYVIKARVGGVWETEEYPFTIAYDEKPVITAGTILSVRAVSAEPYYEKAARQYEIKVQGKVDKLQFVNSSGSTVTISKTAAQIVNNADSTQVWTVSASLKADTYIVKSKIGTAWIDSDYSYTVTYDARPAVDETAFTVDISGKTATFSVTTAANASKIQFVTDSGSTITFSAADYSVVGADGLRHWTIVRTVKTSGTGSYALKVKTTVWTDTGKSVLVN